MRTKRCSRCLQVKTWDDYYPRTRWDDGSVRTVRPECIQCNKVAHDKWRRENLDKAAAIQRRTYQRDKKDPERIGRRRAHNRESHRRINGVSPLRYRTSRFMRGEQQDERLPAGPFCEWLAAWRERENLTALDLADRLGLSERNARAFALGQRDVVPLAVVERALIREGRTMLHELYPALYSARAA